MQIISKGLDDIWDLPVVKEAVLAKKVALDFALRDTGVVVTGRDQVGCHWAGHYKDVLEGRRDVCMRNAVRVGPRVQASLETLVYSKLEKVIPPPHPPPFLYKLH